MRKQMSEMQKVFTKILKSKQWTKNPLVSSRYEADIYIIEQLPALFDKYNIRTLVDVGCRDLFQLRESAILHSLDLYFGIDIVEFVIEENKLLLSTSKVKFKVGNAVEEFNETGFDCIFCKDVLPHLTSKDGVKMLNNFKKSGIKYLLTTHYHEQLTNTDICTGAWRPINLMLKPFNMGKPIESIHIQRLYIFRGTKFKDKILGLWNLCKEII